MGAKTRVSHFGLEQIWLQVTHKPITTLTTSAPFCSTVLRSRHRHTASVKKQHLKLEGFGLKSSIIVKMFACSGLCGWENPQAKLHLVTTGSHRFTCGWVQLSEKMLKARIKWFWIIFVSAVLVNYQPFVNCYPSEGNRSPWVVQNSTSAAWGWWDRAQMLDLHQNTWAGNEHFLLLDSLGGRRPGRVGWY